MLRVEGYDGPGASVVRAGTLDELAAGMRVDPHVLCRTVEAFNTSITRDVPLDAAVKDGRAARTTPPKSNWASPLMSTPFYAFPVTCGITFTFGGLRADQHGRRWTRRATLSGACTSAGRCSAVSSAATTRVTRD